MNLIFLIFILETSSALITNLSSSSTKLNCLRNVNDSSNNPIISRGDVLSKAMLATVPITLHSLNPSESLALNRQDDDANISQSRNVLFDLPRQQPDTVRLYLCRHGQTENNRLHIVQGAHVDPPLNDTGRQMAVRLGQEFAALDRSFLRGNRNHEFSNIIFHSQLKRSTETASIAAQIVNGSEDSAKFRRISKMTLGQLNSLNEVDFGLNCEGRRETASVRMDIRRTYAAWALGNIDATSFCSDKSISRSDDLGETGRSVLQRAVSALTSLTQQAQDENVKSVVAVSHSVFLRTLLSLSMDLPLFEASILQQANGCINVLDLDPSKKPKIVGKKNLFLGGGFGTSSADFYLEVPYIEVVRINEKRHLSGLL